MFIMMERRTAGIITAISFFTISKQIQKRCFFFLGKLFPNFLAYLDVILTKIHFINFRNSMYSN